MCMPLEDVIYIKTLVMVCVNMLQKEKCYSVKCKCTTHEQPLYGGSGKPWNTLIISFSISEPGFKPAYKYPNM